MGEKDGRTRTVTWEDPGPGAEAAKEMSGLEYLRAIMRGEQPAAPMAELVGFGFVEVEEGRVIFECVPAEYHYNPIGAAHGGSPAPWSTRRWAALYIRSYLLGRGIRRSKSRLAS